ncbi:toxin-activating lysine-acyltransferase [Acuticoccus mangrovi]|uniref:RTX toxin-activating lysine-acyltransferase n=1 Tax=Acuticoccus mangrovi TaxID=2796142 RepID=A0A934INI9_9HYPH|nr:toxin-activating lysine-acyltransferase [Acuticoccus mangrovi]MBJ3775462.1 toxin-activating lysine-acyltransferase [Acuticoccus mangrovi]
MEEATDRRIGGDTAAQTEAGAAQHYRVLGELVEIAMHSPVLSRMELRHMGEVFLRPLALDQLRRWHRGDRIVGVATWAWLNDETAAAMLRDGGVAPHAWQSGDQLWFIDVIAPYGDMRAISRDLRNHFRGSKGHSVRWNDDGTVKKIGLFHM